jgi:transposase
MPIANPRDLTDAQWKILDDLTPEPSCRKDRRGRPWKNRRAVLNGILWVLRTGAPWPRFPTVIRRTKRAIAASNNGSAPES